MDVFPGEDGALGQGDVVEEVGEAATDAPQLDLLGAGRLPRAVQVVPADSGRDVPHLAVGDLRDLREKEKKKN